MRHLSASRHPFITAAVATVAGAGAIVLAFTLVVMPLARAAVHAPGQIARAYSAYWDGVGQQFEQACEQTRSPDYCKQYWGTP